MSELVRSAGLLGAQRAVVITLGALRMKIAAALLGPGGVGILAQAMALRELFVALSSFGTRSGYLKLVAECRGREDDLALERLLVTSLTLVTVVAFTIAAIAVGSAPIVAGLSFGESARSILVVWVAVTAAVAVPARLLHRTFTGVLDYGSFLLVAVVESLVSVLAMAALAHSYGVAGAVASFLVVEVVALAVSGLLLARRVARPLGLSFRPASLDRAVAVSLLRLAGPLAITALLAAGVTLLVRGELLRQLGTDANGYYQVAWQVGQNYLGLLGTVLWSYGMPKVAMRLADPDEILRLQNNFLRIVLSLLIPGVLVLLVTRELWIPLLYTEAFLVASPLIAWQLLGELLAMLRQSMNISLLPRDRLGFLVVQAVVYWGSWALLSLAALPHLGLLAPAVGYLLANLVALVVTYAYHHRVLGYRIDAGNRTLLALGVPMAACGVGLTMLDDPRWGRALPAVLAVAWLWFGRGTIARLLARRV